ncbi:MAG: 50S ribosomal protein L27 [candidate division WS2 bacterium ADurb.Bin280]|uniref:Large ribosomal subunit protein bL27 n=1 Tax=candidate division WS2 bacterium ADurb.Bin280 TaxID=1852829 RepID=A0A1V5SFW9_9BACT|nr:MAG: 50S ribosomal protein L27 [candidate division WS2 bacterium ADurb.Bin280]
MAHTKAKGTTKLGRDSQSKRLGVKIYGGSPIRCGQIIIRQRGTKYLPGDGVKRGNDDTLYAVRDGVVKFIRTRYTNFTGNKQMKQRVSVIASTEGPKNISPAKSSAKEDKAKDELLEKQEKRAQKRQTKSDEAQKRKTKSEIIEQEAPIKMITRNKEAKKAPKPYKKD